MLQLDIKKLMSAMQEAAPFTLPEMNKGTNYLYKNIYVRLAGGEHVHFSELDFSAFDSEDISTLYDLYENVFESKHHQANGIMDILRKTAPICKTASYV